MGDNQILPELKLEMTDDELSAIIEKWKGVSEKIREEIKKWKKARDYYIGVDDEVKYYWEDRSVVFSNRLFVDLETLVPLSTSSPAKPIVIIPSALSWEKKDKEVRKQAIKIQKIMLWLYQKLDLQLEFEKLIRQHQIYKIACLKYWIKDWEIFTKTVYPTKLYIDSEATSIDDCDFIWEEINIIAKDLIKLFPSKKEIIIDVCKWQLWTKMTYIEWWSNDFLVCSFADNKILSKKKNPLFDYWGLKKEVVDKKGNVDTKTIYNNFFRKPKIPYIFLNIYNLWNSIIDVTTCLWQSLSLQKNINKRKRQIEDNVNLVWNPIRTLTWFTKEQEQEFNDNVRAWDWIRVNPDQQVNYIQALSLPNTAYNDLEDSRQDIDNIFWIHSTTRGERGQADSWKARQVLREWDQDRQAVIGRAIERMSERLFNAYLQLIKVFYDEDNILPILWKEWSEEFLNFKRDDIAEWLKIYVKPWSTIPDDPNSLKAQWLELAQLWKITNRRLYEMLWLEDVEESVKDLELEWVKAQKEQEKILQVEGEAKAKEEQKQVLNNQIQNIQ